MKNILVTGGGGFIGRNLIHRLLDQGIWRVTCLDQRSIDFYPPEVACVIGSFADRGLLRRLLPGTDVVVHLGSNVLPANNDYVSDVEQNLLGSIALISECQNARVGKIVFASSGGTIYGPQAEIPTREDSPCNPICSYGIIKVAVEKYLQLASRLTGIRTMTLRIANPYGPWQNWNSAQGAVAVFCHKIMNRESIELFGDGSVARDFIYIDDVIDAFLAAIDTPILTESVNIGSGTCRTLKEMISVIEGNLGLSARIQSLPSRGCDVPRSFLDISKAARVLNWSPRTSFAEGIERTIAWQRANPKAY